MERPSPFCSTLRSLSDDELLRRLTAVLQDSRRVEADLVAHIGEVDSRRLFVRQACPSMYAYCTEVLHLSEAEAYLRITVARAARSFPLLLEMLCDGRLHLSGIVRLLPHLDLANAEGLLAQATHKSKRQILELVARVAPRPDVPAAMRRLPRRSQGPVSLTPQTVSLPASQPIPPAQPLPASGLPTSGLSAAGHLLKLCPGGALGPAVARSSDASVEPLAPARYKIQFTASAELHGKLQRLQALLRSSIPEGDLAMVIEEAVTEKLERLEAKRFARARAPRKSLSETNFSPSSRHIPAAVRRAVLLRDGNRCGFADATGRRCTARDRLEFHHRHPFGLGGEHSPRNIMLLCKQHNAYVAEVDYGRIAMKQRRERRMAATASAGS